jgi:hypothetical protein
MDAETRRRVIRRKLDDGSLSRVLPTAMKRVGEAEARPLVIGAGSGAPCVACDERITPAETMIKHGDVRFHEECEKVLAA